MELQNLAGTAFEQKLAAILLRSRGGQGEPLRFRESETAAAF